MSYEDAVEIDEHCIAAQICTRGGIERVVYGETRGKLAAGSVAGLDAGSDRWSVAALDRRERPRERSGYRVLRP